MNLILDRSFRGRDIRRSNWKDIDLESFLSRTSAAEGFFPVLVIALSGFLYLKVLLGEATLETRDIL